MLSEISEVKEKFLHLGLFWLRLWIGLGSAYHGYGKIFGGHMGQFAQGVAQIGFPAPGFFAWAAAFSEFFGGILLILGSGTRWAAFFIFTTMSVAFFIHHRLDPLKVKELALAYWTVAGALIMTGGGKWSWDYLFSAERTLKKVK